jgi:hypothetical protein
VAICFPADLLLAENARWKIRRSHTLLHVRKAKDRKCMRQFVESNPGGHDRK